MLQLWLSTFRFKKCFCFAAECKTNYSKVFVLLFTLYANESVIGQTIGSLYNTHHKFEQSLHGKKGELRTGKCFKHCIKHKQASKHLVVLSNVLHNSVNCDRPGECSPEKDCLR